MEAITELSPPSQMSKAAPAVSRGPAVTIEDVIRNWGESDPQADLDQDGIVGVSDLLLLLERQQSPKSLFAEVKALPAAALGSLGTLLAEAVGLESEVGVPSPSAADSLAEALKGGLADGEFSTANIETAMQSAKGLLDRWAARGWSTAPPPGYEHIIKALPVPTDVRGLVSRLVRTAFAGG